MIRVRFAPSPTGFLHIGGLRTALYNFLFAKKNNGKFVLRIEDTDVKRQVYGAVENLIKTLQAVGLNWDEGPVLSKRQKNLKSKGRYSPYIQSQRLVLYRKFAQKLIDLDKAYYCFCTPEDLEKMRQEQIAKKLPPMYDERCRRLSKKEVDKKIKNKNPYVIRLKVPEEGRLKFYDLIRGEIEFDLKNIDDQVLLKSDGYPTYHLAVVVDDHLMKITHVIRGEEWLPSVPKHLLIYQAFNWPLPKFAHLPLLLNPDRSKLSKRQGDIAVEDYLNKGYLPEALLNFVALLGWNPDTNQEIFSLQELIKNFSLEKIQKAGAIFNLEKLDWLNGYYIRKLEINELTKRCIPYLIQAGLINFLNPKSQITDSKQIQNSKFRIQNSQKIITFNWLKKVVASEQERMKKLTDLITLADFFFKDELKYEPEILIWKKMSQKEVVDNLSLIKKNLEKLPARIFNKKNIQKTLEELAQKQGAGQIFWPFRVALSGKEASPPAAEIAEILGKKRVVSRIEEAIKKTKIRYE
ncbi:MAG: glutamate--tRNA ligase [Patescibacteria group bacterium]|nr:glutamate--tRNA ligase [Patescibacteria group bacterium]